MNWKAIPFCLALIALAVSCGGPPRESEPEEPPTEPQKPIATVFEPEPEPEEDIRPRIQPKRPSSGIFELVWVEPRIVVADTIMTLIQAERIDSVEVSPAERRLYETPSISFRVTKSDCPATVKLLSSRGVLQAHLMTRNLSPGYYKLTLSPNPRNGTKLPEATHLLAAEYCGKKKQVSVTIR